MCLKIDWLITWDVRTAAPNTSYFKCIEVKYAFGTCRIDGGC